MAITRLNNNSITSITALPSGVGGEPNTPAFMAYRDTSHQDISNNTDTKCQFNAELYDSDNCYDNSTNYRFTPNVAGKYFIFLNAIYGRDTSNVFDAGKLMIYKNGSKITQQQVYMHNGPQNLFADTTSCIVDMNGSTDYVEAYININTQSGTRRVLNDFKSNQFGGYRIIE